MHVLIRTGKMGPSVFHKALFQGCIVADTRREGGSYDIFIVNPTRLAPHLTSPHLHYYPYSQNKSDQNRSDSFGVLSNVIINHTIFLRSFWSEYKQR